MKLKEALEYLEQGYYIWRDVAPDFVFSAKNGKLFSQKMSKEGEVNTPKEFKSNNVLASDWKVSKEVPKVGSFVDTVKDIRDEI